jgi:hypothetical protein
MHTDTQAAADELDAFFVAPANYAHAANITAVYISWFA